MRQRTDRIPASWHAGIGVAFPPELTPVVLRLGIGNPDPGFFFCLMLNPKLSISSVIPAKAHKAGIQIIEESPAKRVNIMVLSADETTDKTTQFWLRAKAQAIIDSHSTWLAKNAS